VSLSSGQWLKLAGICGLALVYIAAFYSIAIWVSCCTRRAATSVMILVTLWMVLVLAIPNLSPYLAQAWRPTGSPVEAETARRKSSEDIWRTMVQDKMEAYDKEHGFGRRWRREINWREWESRKRGVERWLYETNVERQASLDTLRSYERIDQQLMSELAPQVALSRWLSRVSPFSCFALAATELSDTGALGKRHFLAGLRKYQNTLCQYAFDEAIRLRQYELDHKGERLDWKKDIEKQGKPVPVFVHAPPAGTAYALAVVADAGILAGVTVLFFLLSYVAFLRYDVR